MKPTSRNSIPVNVKRRRVIQGVGAVAAATVAAPVLSGVSAFSGEESLSGKVISQMNAPVKTLILRNNSAEAVTIEHFANGGLMFDGEVLDCNGACIDKPFSVSSGKEVLIQFDSRQLLGANANTTNRLNVQSGVQRLSAGTRVVDIKGIADNGVVTLIPTASAVYS